VTHQPTIAVVVPNRNDARYLPRCLGSVLGQEVPADELIVVDDQSTDNSLKLIGSLISGHSHARLVVNPVNLGTNATVNQALRLVRSDYALFLAANDFLLPGIFARAKACLARAPGIGMWSAMAWIVDDADRVLRLHPSPVVALGDAVLPPERCVRLAHRVGHWFTGTTAIYRRDALQSAGGFDPAYGAPGDLIAALLISSLHGAAYTPEPFGAIRVHAGSFSSATLRDFARLDAILQEVSARAPRMSPALFDPKFLKRTALRYYFAGFRATGGAAVTELAARNTGWRRTAVLSTGRLVPAALGGLRLSLAFLILRPFDVLPALWYRLLGWVVVRSRVRAADVTPR
jgi:hypothetical protein